MTKRVLVVATSRKTRGGITSVIKAYETTSFWKDWRCHWIESHRDRNSIIRIWYFLKGFVEYVFLAPSSFLVHIHLSSYVSLIRKLPFFLFAKLFKKKIIVHFHADNLKGSLYSKFSKLYYSVFAAADRIIVLSPTWERNVKEFCPVAKTTVVYNPCRPFRVDSKIKKPYILYAGSLIERKGFKDLIRAFSQIANRYPEWRLVLAGNGQIEEGEKLCEKLDIESQVEFLGWISGTKKDEVFNESSIFCLPSYSEGFPMAVLDAFSYGLPVVTTPVGGIPDILENKENALIFPCGDVSGLAQCLENLISDQYLKQKLSLASKNLSENVFNINTLAKQMDNLYSSILNNK